MKLEKVTVRITLEATSKATISGLVSELHSKMDDCDEGYLRHPDGDSIKWETQVEDKEV